MDFQLPEIPTNVLGVTYSAIGLIIAITLIAKLSQYPNLDAFLAVGSSTWIGSWWAGFKYLTDAQNIIQQGYNKASLYGSTPFKIAEPHRWTVILSDREHLDELTRASSNELSSLEAINNQIQLEHTLGPEVHHNPYHVAIIRSHLTRNLEALYSEIRDEIVTSFAEVLDLRGNEWKSVPALSTIEKVICRTSNRIFVDLPLCHNPDWVDLNIRGAIDVVTGGTNDLLSWLMEEAEGLELTPECLTVRMLVVNFAAIHTSSNSFTQALFYLAANPQYIQPLREGVEGIIEKDGWLKDALCKMRKVDSFLKECQHLEGISIVSLARKALKDFKFSDGTFIPKGTSVAVASRSLHYDEHFYKNPELFEPFRFVHMCETDARNGPKHQLVSTTTEYLTFGHGRHACPGCFFAANELKSMLAHIVMTYDVKLEDDTTRPQSLCIGSIAAGNRRAKIMFRNRVD
ncbi:cytochrome P450 [Boletus coccyginus]|nr:cytochrome P450 [Boletus coccyginus]